MCVCVCVSCSCLLCVPSSAQSVHLLCLQGTICLADWLSGPERKGGAHWRYQKPVSGVDGSSVYVCVCVRSHACVFHAPIAFSRCRWRCVPRLRRAPAVCAPLFGAYSANPLVARLQGQFNWADCYSTYKAAHPSKKREVFDRIW